MDELDDIYGHQTSAVQQAEESEPTAGSNQVQSVTQGETKEQSNESVKEQDEDEDSDEDMDEDLESEDDGLEILMNAPQRTLDLRYVKTNGVSKL